MRRWELRSGSDKLKSGCGKVEKGLNLGAQGNGGGLCYPSKKWVFEDVGNEHEDTAIWQKYLEEKFAEGKFCRRKESIPFPC